MSMMQDGNTAIRSGYKNTRRGVSFLRYLPASDWLKFEQMLK